MKKKKYLKKLVFAYFCIIFTYTLIISMVYYYNQNMVKQNEFNTKNKMFLEQIVRQMDTKFMTAENVMNQLMYNENVKTYASNNKKDYYNILLVNLELQKYLDAFAQLKYKISLTRSDDDTIITPNSTTDYKRFFASMGFTQMSLEQFETFSKSDDKVWFRSTKDTLLFALRKKINNQSKEDMFFFITFDLQDLLPSLRENSDEIFSILYKDQVIISSGEEQILISDILNENKEQLNNTNYIKFMKDDYYIHTLQSYVYDMTIHYTYSVPANFLQTENMKVLYRTMFINLILMVMGSFVVFWLASKVYKPVKKVVSVIEGYDEISDEDEFSYIQKNIETINERNRDMQQIINKNKLPLKTKFLKDLIYGIIPLQKIDEQLENNGLEWLKASCRCLLIEHANYDYLENRISSDGIVKIKHRIYEELRSVLVVNGQVEIFEMDYKKLVIILQGYEEEELKKLLSKIISRIENEYHFVWVAAIGEIVDHGKEIKNSYEAAVNLLDSKFALGNKMVISQDDFQHLKNEIYYYPLEIEKSLIEYVLKGKKEAVDEILDRITHENFEARKLIPSVLSQFIFAIVSTGNRILHQQIKMDNEKKDKIKLSYIDLKMIKDKDKIKEKIYELFHEIIEHVDEENQHNDHTLIDEIINYIKNNYNKDISLTDVAECFNLSSGYVGILFKKCTGENFKDYVNMYKVEQAKDILKDHHVKIKEVAQMVGCNNSNTFIRMFKKYEGISPGKYKDTIGIKEEK